MYCSKCGTEIDDNSEYCYNCGAKITSNQNVVNNNSGEEKLKKYLPLILIILSLPLMFIFGFILMITEMFAWGALMVIQASLSVIGAYFLYANRKLYGRIFNSEGFFVIVNCILVSFGDSESALRTDQNHIIILNVKSLASHIRELFFEIIFDNIYFFIG